MLIICAVLCSWHHVEEISVPLAQRSSISPSPILGTPDLLFLYEFAKAGTSYKCSHIILVLLRLLILFSVMFSKLLHHRLHQILFKCLNSITLHVYATLWVCVWVCVYAIVHVSCAEDRTYSFLQKLYHWAYTQSCLCHMLLIQLLFVVTWIAPTSGYCE